MNEGTDDSREDKYILHKLVASDLVKLSNARALVPAPDQVTGRGKRAVEIARGKWLRCSSPQEWGREEKPE